MIITIIADVYGKQNNGTAITAQRLIESLKKRGHEVRLVSPYDCDQEGYYMVPKRNFYCFNNYVEKNGVELAKPDREVLEKAIKGSDVVHIMMPFKLGRAAVEITKAMHIPWHGGVSLSAGKLFQSRVFKGCKACKRLSLQAFPPCALQAR